jgi:hypothetical protein
VGTNIHSHWQASSVGLAMATLRKACCCSSCTQDYKAHLAAVVRPRTDFEDGSKEIAVSFVDLLLPHCDAFINEATTGMGYSSRDKIGGSLNSGGLWESVVCELEASCLIKEERVHRHRRTLMTVYTVPVVGFKQFTPPSTDNDHMPGSYNSTSTENPTDNRRMKKAFLAKIRGSPAKVTFSHVATTYSTT